MLRSSPMDSHQCRRAKSRVWNSPARNSPARSLPVRSSHHRGTTTCRAGAPSIARGGNEPAGFLLEYRQLAGRDIEVGAEQRERIALAGGADERKCHEIVE